MRHVPQMPGAARLNPTAFSLSVLALGLLGHASAEACTSQHNTGTAIHLTIDAWDDAEQDKLISSWRWAGNANFLQGCSGDVPFDVTASLPDLEYVRDVTVDGEIYPAFGLRAHPLSPLLIFRHEYWTGGSGGDRYVPLDVRKMTSIPSPAAASNARGSIVFIAAVSRGGIMQPVPTTLLGPIARVSPLFPHWVKTDTFTITANFKVPTCTLTNTSVTLLDVPLADLPSVGSHAREQPFDVPMTCNGAFPIQMTLTDANAPGNTGSRLTPTANASAGAVQVELLHEGTPVVLGRAWTIPLTQDGAQNVRLSARYYREAGALYGGVVEGQAVITATYR